MKFGERDPQLRSPKQSEVLGVTTVQTIHVDDLIEHLLKGTPRNENTILSKSPNYWICKTIYLIPAVTSRVTMTTFLRVVPACLRDPATAKAPREYWSDVAKVTQAWLLASKRNNKKMGVSLHAKG